jgi:hypothetical protein
MRRRRFNKNKRRATMMDLRTLQRALGGDIIGGQLLAPGPLHSRRDRSMSVKLDPGSPSGLLVNSFSGDHWRDCRDHVRVLLGLPAWQPGDGRDRSIPQHRVEQFDRNVVDAEAEHRPRTEDDLIRIERAQKLWADADDPPGTLAEEYLKSRSLVLTDDVAGRVLRFHRGCPWRDENTGALLFVPALVAAFRSIDDDTVTAIHRIRVDQPERWPKASRKMIGIVHRAAVKLDLVAETTLAIGEGVETCLAAGLLGYRPTWALGSVGAISFFPLIDNIRRLQILGETGAASSRAVEMCGRRWHSAGRKVQIVWPDSGHSDLNDELMAAS